MSAVQSHAAHVQVHYQDRVRVVPERKQAHLPQAANEQPCPDEQHDGKGGLHHEQRDSDARPLEGALARAGLEIAGDVDSLAQDRGRETREQRGNEHRCPAEPEAASVTQHPDV